MFDVCGVYHMAKYELIKSNVLFRILYFVFRISYHYGCGCLGFFGGMGSRSLVWTAWINCPCKRYQMNPINPISAIKKMIHIPVNTRKSLKNSIKSFVSTIGCVGCVGCVGCCINTCSSYTTHPLFFFRHPPPARVIPRFYPKTWMSSSNNGISEFTCSWFNASMSSVSKLMLSPIVRRPLPPSSSPSPSSS